MNDLEIGTCDRCKKQTEDISEVAYGVCLCYDCCDDYNDYEFNITSKGEIEEQHLPKPKPSTALIETTG